MDSLKRRNFSVKDGLAVQKRNLLHWRKILNTKSFELVVEKVNEVNASRDMTTGYDVYRGSDISTFIHNLYI